MTYKRPDCAVKECESQMWKRGLCYRHFKKAKDQGVKLPKVAKTLSVSCWCMTEIVQVSRADVLACLTKSCGAPGCGP